MVTVKAILDFRIRGVGRSCAAGDECFHLINWFHFYILAEVLFFFNVCIFFIVSCKLKFVKNPITCG